MSENQRLERLVSMRDKKPNTKTLEPYLGMSIVLHRKCLGMEDGWEDEAGEQLWGWRLILETTLNRTVWEGFMPDTLVRTLHLTEASAADIDSAVSKVTCSDFPLIFSQDDEDEFQDAIKRLKETAQQWCSARLPEHTWVPAVDHIPITGTKANRIQNFFDQLLL